MRRRTWTKEVDRFLRAVYGIWSSEEMSNYLGIKGNTILNHIYRNKIPKAGEMEWAFYRGDVPVMTGTRREIKKELEIDEDQFRRLTSERHANRSYQDGKILVSIGRWAYDEEHYHKVLDEMGVDESKWTSRV